MRNGLLRLALTVALLIPALGGSSLAYVCEMDGQIRRECCCDHHAAKNNHYDKLEKRGCCDVRSTGGEPITKSTRTVNGYQPPASPVLTSVVAAVTSTAAYAETVVCERAQAAGPPIFLRNCSVLR